MSSVLGGGKKATEDFFTTRNGRQASFAVREGSNDFRVSVDPRIQADRDFQQNTLTNLLTKVQGQANRTDETVSAASSPLRRNLEAARAKQRRDFGRRGLSGSSLSEGFLAGQQRQDETEVSQFESTLRQQLQSLDVDQQRAIITDLSNITRDQLNQEFTSLGLSGGGAQTASNGASGGSSTADTISSIATIASVALAFSDERIKENITRVGSLDNGLPVYTFNYIGKPDIQMGLMAQDVEKVNPNAVKEIGGIKVVNYPLASEA